MPTYEFRCPAGHDFERFFRKISDGTVELPCPECGAMAARRVSGGAGLLFKGSGFYITDYGKDGKGPKKAGDAKESQTAGGAEKSGGESKPAASTSSETQGSKTSGDPGGPSSSSPKSGGKSASDKSGGGQSGSSGTSGSS